MTPWILLAVLAVIGFVIWLAVRHPQVIYTALMLGWLAMLIYIVVATIGWGDGSILERIGWAIFFAIAWTLGAIVLVGMVGAAFSGRR